MTEKLVYEKYKQVLKVNAQQVARKNAEAWESLFKNLKLKKEGKLPSFIIPKPQSYGKDREKDKRQPFLVMKCDRYKIREKCIYLKDF